MRSTFLLVLLALVFSANAVEIKPAQGGADYNDLSQPGAADGAFVMNGGAGTYYAIGISNCFIPANGRLSVGENGAVIGGAANEQLAPGSIEQGSVPEYLLAPFWTNDISGATVYYQNDQANGVLTFDYQNVNMADGSQGNFQVQLFDANPGGLGARFLYGSVSGSASVGASNDDGAAQFSGDASSGEALDVYCTEQPTGGAQAGSSRSPSPSRKPSASPSASPAPAQPRIRSVSIKRGSGMNFVDLNLRTADGYLSLSDEGAFTYTPNFVNCLIPVNKRLRIGQNGAVLLGVASGSPSGSNVRMSEASAYQAFLAPYWDNIAAGGDVFYKIDGDMLIIQWKNVALKNHPGTGGNFELVLMRNAVQGRVGYYMYKDTNFATEQSHNFGGEATVGIKYNTSITTQYSYNSKVVGSGLQLDLYCNV